MKYIPLTTARELVDSYADHYQPPSPVSQTARDWACDVTRTPRAHLLSARRARELVYARMLAAEVLISAGLSYPQAGRALHRDHSSVHHLINDATVPDTVVPYRLLAQELGRKLAAARAAVVEQPDLMPKATGPVEAAQARRAAVLVALKAQEEANKARLLARSAALAARWSEKEAVERGKLRAALLPREFRPTVGEYIEDAGLLARPPTAAVMADLRRAMLREAGVIPA